MTDRKTNVALLIAVALITALASACAPPTVKLKVSRDQVRAGDPVTVSWESKNAKTIELNGQKVEKIGAKTMTPDQTAAEALGLMSAGGFRHVPLVNKERILGVVSRGDFHGVEQRENEEECDPWVHLR